MEVWSAALIATSHDSELMDSAFILAISMNGPLSGSTKSGL